MAQASFKIKVDTISPKIRQLVALGRDTTPIMTAMGTKFKSITEGTFNSVGSSYRPKPWVAKSDGTPSNLQASTTMAKAFHLEVTRDRAVLSNSAKYAAIHQFGGVIVPKEGKRLSWVGPNGKRIFAMKVVMPARPFYPVLGGRLTEKAAEAINKSGMAVVMKGERGH